jgi:hypothetical protein
MAGRSALTRGAAGALALLFCAQAALAGEAQDRLFALGALKGVETGETLVYDYAREGSFSADNLPKVDHGQARLTLKDENGTRTAVAVLRDDTKQVANFDPFPGDAGNPVFLIFMEEAVTTMSKLTGGSVFYIRNRMREALGAQDAVAQSRASYQGRDVPARVLTFQPFLKDKNAAKMGAPFQALTITFVMSDEIPGGFAKMEAVAAAPEGSAPLLDLTFELAKVEES